MSAVCRLESMFTITGRGFVLIVEITEGIIRVGDSIVLPVADTPRRERIAGVEAVSDRGPPRDVVGLLLADLPMQDVPKVKAALQIGQLLDVEAGPSVSHPSRR